MIRKAAKASVKEKKRVALEDALDDEGALDDELKQIDEKLSFPADPFWDNIDVKNTVIVDSNLPTDAYTPARVVDIANAYKELEFQKSGSEAYTKNRTIIDNFEKTIRRLDNNINIARKRGGNREEAEHLDCIKSYMCSMQDIAITLSRRLVLVQTEFDAEEKKEEVRYKKKLDILEDYKNGELAEVKEGKTAKTTFVENTIKIVPTVITAVTASYEVPGAEYVKAVGAVVVGLLTYLPIDYWFKTSESKRIKAIKDDYDGTDTKKGKFDLADDKHLGYDGKIKSAYSDALGKFYRRAIADTVRELHRYVPDAVIIARKSDTPDKINREVETISTALENTLSV